MRLTIPEPKIELYKDGFAEHDKLSRKPTSDKLSELVERFDDPLVIALDGAWGSGKSFFLKCWVGEHLKREGNSTQTVYFDAFKHDYLDDPLIALTGAISERFEEADDKKSQEAWKKAKQVAPALGRALLRTGVSVATAGLVTKADDLADAAINTVSGELDEAVAEFWKRENGKRAAMDGFRQALIDLTEPERSGLPPRKLVIVVDELDRCRPDYALSLLEIVKHFFTVNCVHFVLGVNLTELQNSVRARYGTGIDAAKYLQKFISASVSVTGTRFRNVNSASYIKHFANISVATGFSNSWKYDWLVNYLKLIDHHVGFSLRDAERLITLAQLSPDPRSTDQGDFQLYIGLLVLKVIAPDKFQKARFGNLTFEDMNSIFRIKDRPSAQDDSYDAHVAWALATTQRPTTSPAYLDDGLASLFRDRQPKEVLRNIIADSLDTFILPKGS
ncbi:hypothetical protein HW561_11785 [Rhodobacteraceae bacterium B1Z28]|uniref:KAP NTPase domain-containing protein n=1 Tax=Ruegeria haliotis TaxID=2747601 RepID=A0ABX2PSB5_9RHOB|nr:P-loop NTPase fold protein [Ruegeria haliotis]NVO56467.1 hypothetical protein [Ruegeria haliotis]